MNYGYELIDPRDNLPFYVGITKKPKLRLRQHLMIDLSNYYKTDRIQNILDDGLKPIMKLIFEEADDAAAREMERTKITEYVAAGIDLTNLDHVQPRERGIIRKDETKTTRKGLPTSNVKKPSPVKKLVSGTAPEGYITAKEAMTILGVEARLFNPVKSVFTTNHGPEGYYSREKVEDYNASIMVYNPSPFVKRTFLIHLRETLKHNSKASS